jgi:hypothetical protein
MAREWGTTLARRTASESNFRHGDARKKMFCLEKYTCWKGSIVKGGGDIYELL